MGVKAVVIPVSFNDKPFLVELLDNNHLASLYKYIGCSCIDVVYLAEYDDHSVDMFVDDEGLLNESPLNQYFLRAYRNGLCVSPLAGVGVVTRSNDEGETVDIDLQETKTVLKEFGFTEEELSNLP